MITKRRECPPPLLSITCWERVDELHGEDRLTTLRLLVSLFTNDLLAGDDILDYLLGLNFSKPCALHYVEVLASLINV